MLYNSADDAFSVGATVNAVIYSTGDVSYLPPGMFKSTCIIKIDDFPFDEQVCQLKVKWIIIFGNQKIRILNVTNI